MDTKGILTVEQKQPEKVSKVAKIKEYLKTQLLFFGGFYCRYLHMPCLAVARRY